MLFDVSPEFCLLFLKSALWAGLFLRNGFLISALWAGLFLRNGFLKLPLWTGLFLRNGFLKSALWADLFSKDHLFEIGTMDFLKLSPFSATGLFF